MTEAVIISEASQVADARRRVSALATSMGFDETKTGNVAIITTELCTNLIKHAGGGRLLFQAQENTAGITVEMVAIDTGPGMANVDTCLTDGFSTAGSAGNGLGAVRRLASEFAIYAREGAGTAIFAAIGPKRQPHPAAALQVSGFAVPKPGEQVCGDAWCVRRNGRSGILLVADGLGHGPNAADASHAAVTTFQDGPSDNIEGNMAMIHAALRTTRGAAVSIAQIDYDAGEVRFCGIGNVAGAIAGFDDERHLVSLNGTAGATARRIQSFTYPLAAEAIVVLASDGLSANWTIKDYPGLLAVHPALIAAVLYRDLSRDRDDATVVVVKRALQ